MTNTGERAQDKFKKKINKIKKGLKNKDTK
jgi:hypothetical protein